MSTKKNQKVINYMIDVISDIGFVQDAYGNWKKDRYRYKFNATSYRYEKRIDTKPISWMKIRGEYYKNVKIE